MSCVVTTLKSKKCKITPQRLAIYNIIKKSQDHLNAESIYRMLIEDYPSISLATVYKSLELFSEIGLIQVINIGENSFRYDSNPVSHPHLVCTSCLTVVDLNEDLFPKLTSLIEQSTHYIITKQQLCFYGICPECIS
ncbi:Fur family transcriptional regulator [Serpentinicella alkaliphila]|uniref:Fur family peroxide stress response transcriptional regulator n=1 Tax=Serpentinicella alkaliphila TaxID=1734049 RepID=A0A4R2TF32_9FIRM|nr:Fur family transcriptional regulator [Serpentinicella alkaliphila]QUH25982.1 transcriptional repressor [Serpentinicella alkaliphila]TCQ02160.1 Fur family peroxide stress response transcriptional regulator [Serpentinicella alkaliphila]